MATRGADFGAVQQIALADDAHEATARIDHRGAADATFREQRGQALDRRIWINRDYVGRHYVHRAHSAPPALLTTSHPLRYPGCGAILVTFQPAWQEGSSATAAETTPKVAVD